MVAVAVVAIIGVIAVPSMYSFVKDNRLTTQANDLIADLMTARSTATKNNRRVALCASSNLSSCTGGTAFQGGWIVIVDSNNDGTFAAGEEIVRIHTAVPAETGITITASTASSITFETTGRPTVTGVSYTLNDNRPGNSKVVTVSNSGRPRVEKGS